VLFFGLATRSVNIVIEIPIAENNIRYRAVSDRINFTEEHLKSGKLEINPGQRDIT
jgi:hypothetical protein